MTVKTVRQNVFGLELSVNIKENEHRGNSKGDILFIHGLGCSKESYKEAFSYSKFAQYRLIAIDLPGYGASSKPKDLCYDMQEHADFLKEITEKLDIKNPIIMGHSMGGAVALLLIKQLDSIKYFFSLEGNLTDDDCAISRETAVLPMEEFLTSEYPQNFMKYRCRRRKIDPDPDPLAFYKSSVSLVEMSDSGELLEQYRDLPYPKTYIYGDENRHSKTVALLQGEDIVEVPDSGHFMMNENPEFCYDQIAKRMEEVI